MTEEKLIEELKTGNNQAFTEIFNLYAEKGLKTAYLITSDKYMAEDILQETFIQCFMSIKSLKDNKAFKPWFYRILTRLAYKEIKKHKKILPVECIYEKADSAVNDSYFTDKECNELWAYINKLSIKHKTVIILYYYNNMSIKEIAKAVRCSEGTVKSRLSCARKKLKNNIEFKEVFS